MHAAQYIKRMKMVWNGLEWNGKRIKCQVKDIKNYLKGKGE